MNQAERAARSGSRFEPGGIAMTRLLAVGVGCVVAVALLVALCGLGPGSRRAWRPAARADPAAAA